MAGFKETVNVTPSARQLEWQKLGYYGIICFGMNTFTGDEWGDGFAPADLFWPEAYNVKYWVETAQKAGMKGLMLTAKHYDGFCLWQSEHTDYCLKSCPNWFDGRGDIVADLSAACREAGLKFGIHLTLWDRHEKSYGKGKEYDDYFCGLLTELCKNYGELFEVYLDPLCGEGINGTVQDFDMPRYYKVIRSLQPKAAITGLGPDGRWCGNDRGLSKQNEWSVIPAYLGCDEDGKKHVCESRKKLSVTDPDIGSRKIIKKEDDFVWYPLEIMVPMRNKWFWNKDNDYSAKTKDKLLNMYYASVGNNANFALGLAPNKRGRFSDTEESILSAFGHDLLVHFGYNLVTEKGSVTASSEYGRDKTAAALADKEGNACWRPSDSDKKPELVIKFSEKDMFDKVALCENIADGQHIESFEIYYLDEKNKWKLFGEGTTVGNMKIIHAKPVECDTVRIVFKEWRDFFEISAVHIN